MPPEAVKKDMSGFYTPLAIIVAGALIAGGLYLGLSNGGLTTGGGAQQITVDIKDVNIEGDPYIGSANAPVVMAFWADFQCPYCKAVEVGHGQIPIEPALPELVARYVDTGKLRIVFKDYAFLGEDSITAGEYGRAIWALYPDQYFAWRTAMYEAQDDEGDTGFGDAASIDELIKTKFTKIDLAKVKADIEVNKDKYDAAMSADQQEGASFGIQGTPAFIVGKTLIPGASPLSTFTDAIEPLLK